MDLDPQAWVRLERLAMVRTELASLGAEFIDMRRDVANVVKSAAKRRDDRLLEQTRKDRLS